MRTRYKNYSHYGFSDGEARELKKWCKSSGFNHNKLLRKSAKESNEAISNSIYISIIKGLSYEKIDGIEYQIYAKSDFYAYQRKALAIFRKKLIENNQYPFMES